MVRLRFGKLDPIELAVNYAYIRISFAGYLSADV
jgi:hypothetical protein